MAEQVGGRHLDDQSGRGERPAEALERRRALGVVGNQVVVVEAHGSRAQRGELLDGVHRVHRRPDGSTEDVHPPPAHRPKTEGELVVRGRLRAHVATILSCATESIAVQAPDPELCSTASRTVCTWRPSAKEGAGCLLSAIAETRSTTWWVNPCS